MASLADLLLQRGRDQAQTALSLGDIQARAAQQKADTWGRAIATLADVLNPVKIQAQIAEQKRQAVSDEADQLALAQKKKAVSDQQAVDDAFRLGGSDRGVLFKALQDSGQGHLIPGIMKAFADADEASAKAKTAKDAAAASEADYFGLLAANVKANDYSPIAAAAAIKHAADEGHDVSQIQQALQQDPSKIRQVVDALIAASPAQRKLATDEQTAATGAKNADTAATRLQAERPGLEADAAVKQQVAAGTKNGLTPDQQAALKIQQQNANTAAENARIAGTREQREARAAAGTLDPETDTRTTLSGMKYVDLNDFETPTAKDAARKAAKAQGLTVVDKATGDTLRAADTARLNLEAMWGQIQSKLPKDASGRVIAGPGNRLKQYFQSDADVAAFNSWRAGAIQAVQALVERGMGFRLNQAEINMIMQNDMPQVTDTVQTAKQRVDNVLKLLDDKEKVALTRDRSTLGSVTGQNPFRK
jgi:hypothetical protein